MAWGVKASFVEYVVAVSGGGSVTVDGAVSNEHGVDFPLMDQSDFDFSAARGRIRFGGSVRFVGHFGALDLTLSEPWLVSDSDGATVSVATGSGRVALVVLGPAELSADEGFIVVRDAKTRLLPEGSSLFNGVYETGEAFDPVTFYIQAP